MSTNDCARLEEDLTRLVAAELGAEEARGVEAHLAGCTACAAKRASFERAQEQLRRGWVPLPAAGELEGLLATARRARFKVRLVAAAAAFAALLVPAALWVSVAPPRAGAGWDGDLSLFDLDQ